MVQLSSKTYMPHLIMRVQKAGEQTKSSFGTKTLSEAITIKTHSIFSGYNLQAGFLVSPKFLFIRFGNGLEVVIWVYNFHVLHFISFIVGRQLFRIKSINPFSRHSSYNHKITSLLQLQSNENTWNVNIENYR